MRPDVLIDGNLSEDVERCPAGFADAAEGFATPSEGGPRFDGAGRLAAPDWGVQELHKID